jgi:hypothetical protein
MEDKEIIERLRGDDDYYGEFGKQFLSNSDIKVLKDEPESYGLPVEPNENLEKGRLFHQLILEPDKAKDFPIADFSRRDAKYKEWCESKGLTYALKTSEADEVKEIVDWFKNEDTKKVKGMKEYIYDFDAIYEEPMVGEIMGHKFKGKADIIAKDVIIDIKTSGDVAKWTRNAPFYGYDTQAFIYQKLFGMPVVFFVIGKTRKAIGTKPDKFTYDAGIFTPKPETLEGARLKVEHALHHYDKHFGENADTDIEEIIFQGQF